MIASIILPALFVASGLFALATIALALRGHGDEIRALRRQLALVNDFREVSVRVAVTETHEFLPVARRNGLRRLVSSMRPARSARRVAA
jgi:hypothetical protein